MEILHTLSTINALGAITLIFVGVLYIRHSLRRIILHSGARHV